MAECAAVWTQQSLRIGEVGAVGEEWRQRCSRMQ